MCSGLKALTGDENTMLRLEKQASNIFHPGPQVPKTSKPESSTDFLVVNGTGGEKPGTWRGLNISRWMEERLRATTYSAQQISLGAVPRFFRGATEANNEDSGGTL